MRLDDRPTDVCYVFRVPKRRFRLTRRSFRVKFARRREIVDAIDISALAVIPGCIVSVGFCGELSCGEIRYFLCRSLG